MGQRSQIYVKYETKGYVWDEKQKKRVYGPNGFDLIARYFGWNYGERMISRARYTMEWLLGCLEFPSIIPERCSKIMATNFDMIDILPTCDIIQEWKEFGEPNDFKEFVFLEQDNNDGQLYIEIKLDGTLKYAFTHPETENKILSASEYMNTDDEGWENSEYITEEGKQKNRENMKWIEENATLMTDKELEDFRNYDYGYKQAEKTA